MNAADETHAVCVHFQEAAMPAARPQVVPEHRSCYSSLRLRDGSRPGCVEHENFCGWNFAEGD